MFNIFTLLTTFVVISSVTASIESEILLDQNSSLFSKKLLDGALAGSEDDISEITDMALATVRGLLKSLNFDRIPLPNATIEFREIIVGIEFHGVIGLYNGLLTGIETLHRTGDAKIIVETNGDILAQVEIGMFDVAFEYSLILQFMGIGPRATFIEEFSKVSIEMVVRLGADSKISMERLQVKDTGFFRVTVKGLGFILNFVTEIISNVLGNMAMDIIVELIEGPILDIINAVIGGILPRAPAYEQMLFEARTFVVGGGQPIYKSITLQKN